MRAADGRLRTSCECGMNVNNGLMPKMVRTLHAAVAAACSVTLFFAAGAVHAGPQVEGIALAPGCETIRFKDGFISYNDPTKAWNIKDTNDNHCDRNVRNLTGNARHNKPRGLMIDINWTLFRIPNHYECMSALVRYQTKKGYPFFPEERQFPRAECYIQGAINIWPNDPKLWFMLGYYYQRAHRPEDSIKAYAKVLDLSPSYLDAHYNLGLLYTEAQDYQKALEHARIAYDKGYPLPGLKHKLERAGVWEDGH